MFGVWLDEDVAGRKAGSANGPRAGGPAQPFTPEDQAAEEAALLFAEGVQVPTAIGLFLLCNEANCALHWRVPSGDGFACCRMHILPGNVR